MQNIEATHEATSDVRGRNRQEVHVSNVGENFD